MAWAFGISEVTTMPWSFEEDVDRYARLGARAIEIWEKKLSSDPDRRRDQLRLPAERGLEVSSFQANVHSLFPTRMQPEPRAFDDRFDALVAVIESCAPLLPGAVFVLNTGIAAGGDVHRAFERTQRAYDELARRAESLGVRLALEPLHPLAMNEDSFIWGLEDALELVEAAQHPAIGLCADAWNLAGQFALRDRLSRCSSKIFLAQVADWRRPRSFLDRVALGDGTLDFHPFFDGLEAAGYAGPIVLEIFSQGVPDSLYDGDLGATVSRSRDVLERLIGEAARR